MTLTLNQVLLIILTVAAVVVAVYLVRVLAQLRRVTLEAEKAMADVRELVKNMTGLEALLKERLISLGEFVEASKKTAVNLSEATFYLTTRVLRPGSKFLPLMLPLASFFWKEFRKRKEKKNGG
jgi:uncharacterized protein YoxC